MMSPYSRREFLGSLVSAAALLGTPSFARAALKLGEARKVLIVGGGISGLYAAHVLERKGFQVELLEASGRTGGKLLGRKVGSVYFDMGGQALSLEMKRVKALGKRLGLTMIPRPEQKEFFLRDGKKIEGDKVEKLRTEINEAQNSVAKYFPTLDLPDERKKHGAISVEAWIKTLTMSSDAEAMFRSTFVAEWCDTPDNISFLHYLDFSRSNIGEEGEMDWRYREGFFSLADRLRRELRSPVRLNSPAEKIEVAGKRVTVVSGEKKFEGDFLILATPAPQMANIGFSGVDATHLKDALALFQGASVKKAIAVYDKPFWGKKAREGLFDPPSGLAIMENSDEAKKVWSLAAFAGGPLASISKEKILASFAEAFGKEALTPVAYDEELWGGSRFMTGGYGSNRRPGAVGWQAMPRRVGSRILLAGSDTADLFPSYVEGALSAADRAVDMLVKEELTSRVARGS